MSQEKEWYKEYPLFAPENLTLPQELDEETEQSSLGALVHLINDEETTEEKVENWKYQGNVQFQKRNYQEALDCYSKALECWYSGGQQDKSVAGILYSNRAAVQLRLKNYKRALEESKESLKYYQLKKSYYRACVAALELNQWKEANNILKQASQHAPLEPCVMEALEERVKKQQAKEEEKKVEGERLTCIRRTQIDSLKEALKIRNICLGLPIFVSQNYTQRKPELVQNELFWPVLFVYPVAEQSDFFESCSEHVTLDNLLSMAFPDNVHPHWDTKGLYKRYNLQVFYRKHWTSRLFIQDESMIVEKLYFMENQLPNTCSLEESYMGAWIRVSEEQTIAQIISQDDYIVPLFPLFIIVPKGVKPFLS